MRMLLCVAHLLLLCGLEASVDGVAIPICDSMAATLMRQGKIDRVLVGADRIAVNNVGSFSLEEFIQNYRGHIATQN